MFNVYVKMTAFRVIGLVW